MNLKEEVRCGFLVTKEKKQVWNVLLDLYKEFERVCLKNNLKFFAIEGTAIGAIRHKGFIPWDDDIDIGMLRDDYEKLAEIAKSEFKDGYFFQNTYTDKILRVHAQLRKEGTTCLLKNDFKKPYHKGIFIDIFVFDSLPDLIEDAVKFYKSVEKKFKYIFMDFGKKPCEKGNIFISSVKNIIKFCYVKMMFCFHGGKKKAFKKFEQYCQSFNNKNTQYCGKVSFNSFNHRYFHFAKDDFLETIEVPFEDTSIMVPKGYDHFLKEVYGDYMVVVKAPSSHGDGFFDVNNSYKKYDNLTAKDFKKLFI